MEEKSFFKELKNLGSEPRIRGHYVVRSGETYGIFSPQGHIKLGELPIDYAYHLVIADIQARFRENFYGDEIIAPRYNMRALGVKPGELIIKPQGLNDLHEFAKEYIFRSKIRKGMSLLGNEAFLDTHRVSIKKARETFLELFEQGYLLFHEGGYALNVSRIKAETEIEQALSKIKISPLGVKNKLKNIITDTDFIKISEGDARKVNLLPEAMVNDEITYLLPDFVGIYMWEAYYPTVKLNLLSALDSELKKFVMLRLLVDLALKKEPSFDELLIFNKLTPEGGCTEWDLYKIVFDSFHADPLRYAFAKSFSLKNQRKLLQKSLLTGGERLAYLLYNLDRVFYKKTIKEEVAKNIVISREYLSLMESFRYRLVLRKLEQEAKDLSKQINQAKRNGKWEEEQDYFYKKYIELNIKLNPFLPYSSFVPNWWLTEVDVGE